MIVDLLVIACLALFAWRGMRSGVIAQLAGWAGFTFAGAFGKPLALILTLLLARDLGFPPVEVRVGFSVACFFTLYLLATWVVKHALRKSLGRHAKARKERAAGFLLGLGKGIALTFVLLSCLIFFESPLTGALRVPPEMLDDSLVAGFVRRHDLYNPAPLPTLAKVQELMEAARDPRSLEARRLDPESRALLNDPKLGPALRDEKLAHAVRSGDWPALQDDPRILALLKDTRFLRPLSDPLDEDE